MKSLVIVGSAPLKRDYSEFINSCDCVVRFNNCKNYGGNAGEKTDILFLNNSGDPVKSKTLVFLLQPRTDMEIRINLPYLTRAEKIWFVRPINDDLIDFLKKTSAHANLYTLSKTKEITNKRNIAAAIVQAQKIPYEKIHTLPDNFPQLTWQKLLQFGSTNALSPSTGMLGIETLLHDQQFNQFTKYIIGFGWRGWYGHPWKLEKKLVKTYVKEKRLIPLDKNEFRLITISSLLSIYKKYFK